MSPTFSACNIDMLGGPGDKTKLYYYITAVYHNVMYFTLNFVNVGHDQANGQETVIFSQDNSKKFATDLTSVTITSHITSVSTDVVDVIDVMKHILSITHAGTVP